MKVRAFRSLQVILLIPLAYGFCQEQRSVTVVFDQQSFHRAKTVWTSRSIKQRFRESRFLKHCSTSRAPYSRPAVANCIFLLDWNRRNVSAIPLLLYRLAIYLLGNYSIYFVLRQNRNIDRLPAALCFLHDKRTIMPTF
jgi:hypothetical protein